MKRATYSGQLKEDSTTLLVDILLQEIKNPEGIQPRKIIFEGPLGAGKTRIIRDLLHELGVSADILSPSYTLCHEYVCSGQVYEHWDVYRLSAAPEELLHKSEALQFIEWGEKFPEIAPDITVKIYFVGELREFEVYIANI